MSVATHPIPAKTTAGIAVELPSGPRPAPAAWSPPSSNLIFWGLHLLFWAVTAAASLLVVAVYRPDGVESPGILGARIGSLCLAAAGMRWLSKRPGLLHRLDISRTGLVIGGLLTAAVVITLVFAAVEVVVPGGSVRPSRGRLVADLAVNLTLLGNWCALYFGWQLIRERASVEFRAIEAESLALRNELHRLQAQISPHFLFNSLNTVLACRDDPEQIEIVTQSLAAYLRFLLRPAATLEPLGRELDAIEHYLTVQSMRFGDGVVTRIDCDLDVRHVPVPPVLVQPLVENALKYGFESGVRPLQVEISARRDGGCLVIEVANTGRWIPPGSGGSTGTGLHSVERRLRLLVGNRAQVSHMEQDGWVRVRVRVPLVHEAVGSTREEA